MDQQRRWELAAHETLQSLIPNFGRTWRMHIGFQAIQHAGPAVNDHQNQRDQDQ